MPMALVISAAPLLVRMASPVDGGRLPRRALGAAPLLILLAVAGVARTVCGSLVGHPGGFQCDCVSCRNSTAFGAIHRGVDAGHEARRTRPRLAGAVCGLVAAGIAATFYALHCDDDSPLFVAVWYTLGIGIVTTMSAVIGGRVLRW